MNRGEAGGQKRSPAPLTVVPGPVGKVPAADASFSPDDRSPRSSKLLNRVLPLRPLSALPDERLIEMTRAGSERAFETLAGRYRRQLLVYAERMLGAENRAEDALQQAFLQAWVALRGGAEVAEARPWLYRIVHNCAVSIVRRPRHDCVELSEELDAAATDSSPESRLMLGEIFDHLALMPAPQREAIVMTAIGGRSHEEAAAALGLSDGAVRGLVYRARSALRRAAAAILPVGVWNWVGRRQSLGGDAADAAGVAGAAGAGSVGAAGSVGLAALAVKGGAIVATAGVIAGAGHGLLAGSAAPSQHHHRATQRVVGAHAPAASRQGRAGPLLPAAVAASQVAVAEARGEGNHDRHRRGAGEHGGGRAATSGSSDRGGETSHRGGSSNGGGGSGPGSSSNGGGERSTGSSSSGGSDDSVSAGPSGRGSSSGSASSGSSSGSGESGSSGGTGGSSDSSGSGGSSGSGSSTGSDGKVGEGGSDPSGKPAESVETTTGPEPSGPADAAGTTSGPNGASSGSGTDGIDSDGTGGSSGGGGSGRPGDG